LTKSKDAVILARVWLAPPRTPYGGKANFPLGRGYKYLLQERVKPTAQFVHRLLQARGGPELAAELYQEGAAHEGSVEQ